MLSVVFDMDGVLADFIYGFLWTARSMVNREITIHNTGDHPSWDFEGLMTKREETEVWRLVKTSGVWWANLPPLVLRDVFERINKISKEANVYFCTARPCSARPASTQTAEWLQKHGVEDPNVVVSKMKGDFCKAVGADFALDDKWDNAQVIHWISPETVSVLLDRPYNQVAPHPKVGSNSVTRVRTVNEFLSLVEAVL